MRELDVRLQLVGNQRRRGIDIGLSQQDRAGIAVEFLGVFQRLLVAARLDIVQNLPHDLPYFGGIASGVKRCFL